jgi:acyl-[acyl-carrier-protein]-phospholipid O-acyltransferase/long-chain-fatty-acid--[acyl-carrier-protein] ligase
MLRQMILEGNAQWISVVMLGPCNHGIPNGAKQSISIFGNTRMYVNDRYANFRRLTYVAGSELTRDRSFFGITATQFLGAFNDNFYKQLMLLLAIPVVPGTLDQQQVATIVFALPFVLFSGIAGHLSDKYSKNRVIVLAKAAEIGIMGLGLMFLMGIHSAFFGPSKYGILPELFRNKDLPRANGIVLMTTFLAIIFGTVSAGFLGDLLVDHGSM